MERSSGSGQAGKAAVRIPITMSHGVQPAASPLANGKRWLLEDFEDRIKIASELGFETIGYDELAAWREGRGNLPARPLMIDFDHAVISLRYGILDMLNRYGYTP